MTKYCIAVGIITLVCLISGLAQTTSTDMKTNESSFVALLKRKDEKKSAKDAEVISALQGLAELSKNREIKSPDTYKEVARFLEIIHVERWEDIRSNLQSHAAELVLYWGGKDSIPILTDILLAEPETSKKYICALETIVYIAHNDSDEAYSLLLNRINLTASEPEREKLLSAALKIKALNQK